MGHKVGHPCHRAAMMLVVRLYLSDIRVRFELRVVYRHKVGHPCHRAAMMVVVRLYLSGIHVRVELRVAYGGKVGYCDGGCRSVQLCWV